MVDDGTDTSAPILVSIPVATARAIAGRMNLDGQFDSTDLVQVFAAGQFEDTIFGNSTWATGDWNGDGEFDTSDLVLAFQGGNYQ